MNASLCCEKAVACPRCGDDACYEHDDDVIDCTVIGPVHEVCHACPRCDEMEDVA